MTDSDHLAFSRDEYLERVERLRERMRERGIDALIVTEAEHLGYLTGFSPSATILQACIVPLDGDPVIVLRRLDEPTFVEHSWLQEYRTFNDAQNPVMEIADAVSACGLGNSRVGVEVDSHYMTVQQYQALQATLPGVTWVDFSTGLWELRLRKSPEEIAVLRRAAAIADQAMRRAIDAVGEGVSERRAAAAAASAYIELGADASRVGLIASGKRTESLHGRLADQPLERGEITHIGLLPSVEGYCARLMRPAAIGQATQRQRDAAARLIEFQNQQFDAMRPGAVACNVDRVLRDQVLAEGLPRLRQHNRLHPSTAAGCPPGSAISRGRFCRRVSGCWNPAWCST